MVLRSGTLEEQSIKAVLVGDDSEADLAVLKVTGVKNAPQPIDWEKEPKLRETMPVLAFGFPFGAALDPKQKNPAITVTKGAVSALRLDRGVLSEVQLDLDLNPGNSGGPIVDERGALSAWPLPRSRTRPSASRCRSTSCIAWRKAALRRRPRTTRGRLRANHRFISRPTSPIPLANCRSPTLLYGLADEVKMPARGKDGWEALAGAKSSPLQLENTNAVATLALVSPTKGEAKVLVQVSFENAAGRTIYGEPKSISLGTAEAAPAPAPAPPVVTRRRPTAPKTAEDLTKLLDDLQSPDETTRQKAAEALTKWPPKERLDEVKQKLMPLLSSPNAATRTAAVKALAACDPKEVPPELVKLLEDKPPSVRWAVLYVLKDRKDAHFAEAVAARLPTDGAAATDALRAMGPAAEQAVLPYLTHNNPHTRTLAFQIIKDIGTAASVPALEKAIQGNGSDATAARNALQSVRERLPLAPDEWPQTLEDLRSADAGRRAGAVRRIAPTPPVDNRPADLITRLEPLLNDQSADVRAAAVKALVRWDGKSAVPLLAKRLEGFDPGAHAIIIEALAELKDDPAAAAAIAKRVPDAFDRVKAVQALKVMNQSIAEKSVLALLDDTNVFVRVEVCKVLADLGGRESIAPLEQLVRDNNVFYSGPATQALAAIKARLESGEKK